MTILKLPLEGMSTRHPGLFEELEITYKRSASVILNKHHQPPQEFRLYNDDKDELVSVEWEIPDARVNAALRNRPDATRDGAYIIAIAALEISKGLVALGRTESLSGADYYVAPIGTQLEDLEEAYKLEVSGTEKGESVYKSRITEKIEQAKKGTCNLPALAAVVGFSIKKIAVKTVGG